MAESKERIWIGYGSEQEGDLVLDTRHGEMLVERKRATHQLPTELYTTILVTPKNGDALSAAVYMLSEQGWLNARAGMIFPTSMIEADLGEFEILSEPRALTARAVLNEVRDRFTPSGDRDALLDEVAAKLGIAS